MAELSMEGLGLTKTESKVYLELLKLGSTKTGPLIKKTELHRATVYDVLKRLMEKGLATYIVKEKTKYFQASSPDKFLEMLETQKQEIENKENIMKNVVKKLHKLQEQSISKESAGIFQGKKGIKTIFEDILNCKEYSVLASKGRFREILGVYFDQFQKKKSQKKIKSRILIDETLKGTDYAKSIKGDIRFLPKEYNYPTATFIYGDKVAFFVFTEYPTAFVIESKEVAKSYKSYFELLWSKSDK